MREYKKAERGKGRERVLKRDKRMGERRERSRMTKKNKENTVENRTARHIEKNELGERGEVRLLFECKAKERNR